MSDFDSLTIKNSKIENVINTDKFDGVININQYVPKPVAGAKKGVFFYSSANAIFDTLASLVVVWSFIVIVFNLLKNQINYQHYYLFNLIAFLSISIFIAYSSIRFQNYENSVENYSLSIKDDVNVDYDAESEIRAAFHNFAMPSIILAASFSFSLFITSFYIYAVLWLMFLIFILALKYNSKKLQKE